MCWISHFLVTFTFAFSTRTPVLSIYVCKEVCCSLNDEACFKKENDETRPGKECRSIIGGEHTAESLFWI